MGDEPSLAELAEHFRLLATEAPDSTARERRRMRAVARRLRRGARWEGTLHASLPTYLLHVGVLRYGVVLGAGVGCLLLLRHLASADQRSVELLVPIVFAMAIGCGFGVLIAAMAWHLKRQDVRDAYQVRAAWQSAALAQAAEPRMPDPTAP